jgi:hypothetical protein
MLVGAAITAPVAQKYQAERLIKVNTCKASHEKVGDFARARTPVLSGRSRKRIAVYITHPYHTVVYVRRTAA